MNPDALCHLAIQLLSVPGFALLALAMARHQEDLLGRTLQPVQSRYLRLGGWLLLAAALAVAVEGRGWGLGLVSWIGHLSLAAGLVFTTLIVLQRIRASASRRQPAAARPGNGRASR